MYTILTFLCITTTVVRAITLEDYQNRRNQLLEQETTYSLGGKLKLCGEEIEANRILMGLKEEEHNSSFYHPEVWNFTKHYFTYRDYIQNSKVYQLIRKMPKGAALHTHATFLLDADFLVKLTYEDHLHICYTNDNIIFHFAEHIPARPCDAKWSLVSELRNASGDVNAFDARLKKYFTLICDENDAVCPIEDLHKIWQKFDRTHEATKTLITYRPVREKFIYESLKRFYDDDVMYVEMRTGLHILYELNGTKHDAIYAIRLHRDVTERFMKDHPDFIGVKLIITKHRAASIPAVEYAINMTRKAKREYPDMIAGFDLVGQEDKGKPLTDFIPTLLAAKDDIAFFFHAGETNWFGTPSDENLIDAVLLGTKRIGHGYALSKHPILGDLIKEQDIAIEVNVISNAVLALTSDVKDHPLATFLSLNLPVVLSSDDPGVWGAEPLSHDFYISFVAVANRKADLRLLKQLAINSIRYSALENKRKVKFTKVFEHRWKQFIREVLESKKYS